MTKPSPEKSRLIAAIRKARANVAQHGDDDTGLSATRRIGSGVNNRHWTVSFSNRPDRFLTVLRDGRVSDQTDDAIAELILDCWDSDWDDVLKDNPVGDYRLGSSDFKQRNKKD